MADIRVIVFDVPARGPRYRQHHQNAATDFAAAPVTPNNPNFIGRFRPTVYNRQPFNYEGCDLTGPSGGEPNDPADASAFVIVFDDPSARNVRSGNLYYQFQSQDTISAPTPTPSEASIFVVAFNVPAAGARFSYNGSNADIAFDELNDHTPPRFTPAAHSLFNHNWWQDQNTDFFVPTEPETNPHFIGLFSPSPRMPMAGYLRSYWQFAYNTLAADDSLPTPPTIQRIRGAFRKPDDVTDAFWIDENWVPGEDSGSRKPDDTEPEIAPATPPEPPPEPTRDELYVGLLADLARRNEALQQKDRLQSDQLEQLAKRMSEIEAKQDSPPTPLSEDEEAILLLLLGGRTIE